MSVVTATILSYGKRMDPTYEILSIDITKEANRIPLCTDRSDRWRCRPAAIAISDTDFFEPGRLIEIKFRYEERPSLAPKRRCLRAWWWGNARGSQYPGDRC